MFPTPFDIALSTTICVSGAPGHGYQKFRRQLCVNMVDSDEDLVGFLFGD